VKRRAFIGLLGRTVVAWPILARAQQPKPMRRIAVLVPLSADDAESQARVAALMQALQQLGWTPDGNVRIDIRWAGNTDASIRKHAAELATLSPDVILANGSASVGPLLQATRTVPIVFVTVPDPVGAGFVESLARPGGNATGFINFEYSIGGKWLELLRQVAPATKRVAVLRDPILAVGAGQFGAVQTTASSLGIEPRPIDVRDSGEIERAIATFARTPNGVMIVTGSASAVVHRELIVRLAARYKLPAIYFQRRYVSSGGLMCYGPDIARHG
jgi:ABC-type uncharacterized transport system substrate-binding protein